MKKSIFLPGLSLATGIMLVQTAAAQSTPPLSKAELEAFYTTTIENRAGDLLKPLNLTDSVKSNEVHNILVAQYRALRTRDETIDAKLEAEGKTVNYSNRAEELAVESKPLHDQFLAKLGQVLTPDQVDQVEDLMTYNKVKFTYTAYCNIVPDLTDADKAKVMELLKAAREEAIDGGNAPEKSSIFQKYKDQINVYLDAHGHDVAKATEAWKARQVSASTAPAAK